MSKRSHPTRSAAGDLGRFLTQWVQHPRQIGAVAPSSRRLAETMAEAAAIDAGTSVVEFGPGTGVVTRALLKTGVAARDLVLVEIDPKFEPCLRAASPGSRIMIADAIAYLETFQDDASSRTIVSSLPLHALGSRQRQHFSQLALNSIGPNGLLVQFTYGWSSPIIHDAERHRCLSIPVLRNVPPAFVWRYRPVATKAETKTSDHKWSTS